MVSNSWGYGVGILPNRKVRGYIAAASPFEPGVDALLVGG
jgi:hypothetical protein